ncbi:MAG: hypothetical protein IKK75_12175 [Clostridia bacterium]|nr:hypothetical protein [Clostridia bacterium]
MQAGSVPVDGMHKGCPHCGGLLHYDISSEKLKCFACGELTELTHYDPAETDPERLTVMEYRCPQCGASLHTTDTSLISYCNHCGSEVLFSGRIAQTIRPDYIAPFRVTREECERIYRERVNKAFLAPEPARKAVQADHFQPMYVPFYLHILSFEGDYDIEYQKGTVTVNTSKAKLKGTIEAKGEAQCAAAQFDPLIADQLCMNTQQVKDFRPGYLCGFYAEAPDLQPDQNNPWLKMHIRKKVSEKMLTLDYAQSVNHFTLPKESNRENKMVLMPVWLLGRKQGARMLYTAIDGVKGTIVCETPVHQGKMLGLAAAIGVLFALVFLLLNSVIILRAKLVAGLCALLLAACYYVVQGTLIRHQSREDQLLQRLKAKGGQPPKEREDPSEKKQIVKANNTLDYFTCLVVALLARLPLIIPEQGFAEVPFFFCLFAALSQGMLLLGARRLWTAQRMLKVKQFTIKEWCGYHLPYIAAAALSLFFIFSIEKNTNMIIAMLIADKGWLAPFLCFVSAASVLLGMWKNGYEVRFVPSSWLLAAVLAGMGALMLFYHLQWVYYGFALVMIAGICTLITLVMRRHNEFVTRPVPYFGEEAEK